MRFTIAAFLVALSCSSLAARPEAPVSVVRDLRYGTALYDYFLGNYRNALVELMLAERRGGIQGHGDRPRVMEGGFSLAYGMDRKAGDIFDEVLTTTEDPEVRDTAWYYLARMRYLRQDWDATAEALSRISDEPPQQFQQDLLALQVNLAIQQGELDQAATLLQQGEPRETWLPYLYYNLGAAESRAGNYAAAIPLYNRLADIPLHTDQSRALYDRAMTAAGYSYLHMEQYAEAQAQFSQVRLHSPLNSRALLGYGWAAAQQENYLEALAPWQRLAAQPLSDESAQEALVAVPYAYERLGHRGEAVKQFVRAQERLTKETERIDAAITALEEDDAIVKALQFQGGDEQDNRQFNWIDAANHEQLTPQLTYLAELFARNSFQGQLQELRDLMEIRDNLGSWLDKLSLYSDMLNEREASRSQQVAYLEQQQVDQKIADLRQRRDLLAAELDRVRSEQDYLALADQDTTELQRRVERVAEITQRLEAEGVDVSVYREARRRYAGLLLWRAAEGYAGRVWQAQRRLKELDEQLQSLETVKARVEQYLATAEDLAPYRQRISESRHRLNRQLTETDATIAALQQQLRGSILAELNAQRERLHYYLAQSRLAVARLYDSAEVQPQ